MKRLLCLKSGFLVFFIFISVIYITEVSAAPKPPTSVIFDSEVKASVSVAYSCVDSKLCESRLINRSERSDYLFSSKSHKGPSSIQSNSYTKETKATSDSMRYPDEVSKNGSYEIEKGTGDLYTVSKNKGRTLTSTRVKVENQREVVWTDLYSVNGKDEVVNNAGGVESRLNYEGSVAKGLALVGGEPNKLYKVSVVVDATTWKLGNVISGASISFDEKVNDKIPCSAISISTVKLDKSCKIDFEMSGGQMIPITPSVKGYPRYKYSIQVLSITSINGKASPTAVQSPEQKPAQTISKENALVTITATVFDWFISLFR